MFDLGMQELVVIFIVALLVFGPKRLPELSRALGKGISELKIALRGVKDTIEEAETQIEESASGETKKEAVDEEKDEETPEQRTEQSQSQTIKEHNNSKADNG